MGGMALYVWLNLVLQAIGAFTAPTWPNTDKELNVSSKQSQIIRLHPIPQSSIHSIPHVVHDQKHNIVGPNAPQATHSLAGRDLGFGYVAYAYWGNTSPGTAPIASFTTSWIVPPIPNTGHGDQLLYLFNALQPTSGVSRILQPVLQYGISAAGGGDYWSVASWWVNDGEALFTPAIQVSPGQVLEGVLTLTNITSTSTEDAAYGYNSVFTGIPGSSLTVISPVELTFAWEVLEIYRANQTSDLPPGKTEMKSINLITNNGQRPPVSWTPSADSQFGVSVVIDGAMDGEVDIIYPQT